MTITTDTGTDTYGKLTKDKLPGIFAKYRDSAKN
jgi:hypothetical protein